MKPKDIPDYTKCRTLFENYLKTEGKTMNSKLEFKPGKKSKVTASANTKTSDSQDSTDEPSKKIAKNGVPKARRGKKPVLKDQPIDSDNCENETPENSIQKTKGKKRKSSEPSLVVKVKKTKLTSKATPPVKRKYVNIATQTSLEKIRKSPRKVSFDSPICEVIGEKKAPKRTKDTSQESVNSSGDIFEDSFVIEEKKVKPKRKLLSAEEITVKRVIKKKQTIQPKTKSWKDLPTVVNGRSPPK